MVVFFSRMTYYFISIADQKTKKERKKRKRRGGEKKEGVICTRTTMKNQITCGKKDRKEEAKGESQTTSCLGQIQQKTMFLTINKTNKRKKKKKGKEEEKRD